MPVKSAKSFGVKALGQGLGGAEPTDPEFNQTVLLLHADGSEGAGDTAKLGDPNYKAFKDNSTSSHAITVQGDAYGNDFSPYYYADGYWSNYFNQSDYIDIASSSDFAFGTGDFTVDFWVYLFKLQASDLAIFDARTTNGAYVYIMKQAAGKFVYYANTGARIYSNDNAQANRWYHLAVVRNSGTTYMYVDGLQQTQTYTDSTSYLTTGIRLGANRLAGSEHLPGFLSNVRVVKGHALYESAFTPSTTPFTDPTTSGELSVYFDGTNDYLSVEDSDNFNFGSGDFTIEFWVYSEAHNAQNIYVGQWQAGQYSYAVLISNASSGNLRMIFSTNGSGTAGDTSASTGYPLNTWRHCALVRDGSTMRLFQNGVQVATTSAVTLHNSTAPFSVGAASDGTLDSKGYISNVRVIKGTALYTSTFTPSTSPFTTSSQSATSSEVKLLTCQSKSFVDESSSSHGITANGNSRITEFSPFNDGYWSNYFDGSGDYLTTSSSSDFQFGTGAYTVELWIYPTSGGGERGIFASQTSSYYGISMWRNGTNLYLEERQQGYSSDNPRLVGTITLNKWNHIALSRDSTTGTLRGFIDGTQFSSTTSNLRDIQGNVVTIGDNPSASNPFDGYISNVRLTNSNLYTGTFTPSTSPFTSNSNTKLLTCQSNRFIDNSTNEHTITVTGNTAIDEFIPFQLLSRQTKLITCQGNRFKDVIPDRRALTITNTPKVSTNTPFTVTKTANVGSGFFDGSDYLQIADSADFDFTGEFTLEAWIYWTSTDTSGAYQTIVSTHKSGNTNTWAIYVLGSTNQINGYVNGTIVVASDINVVRNTWTHVAFTRDSSNVCRVFVNGTQCVPTPPTLSGTVISLSDGVRVGYDHAVNAYFTGYIADVNVIQGTAKYTSDFTPTTSTISADTNTKLLTCQYSGAVRNVGFLDDSKYNHQITRNGDVSMGTFSPFSAEDGYWSNHFPGSSDVNFASSTTFNITDYVTLECWVYFDSLGPDVIVGREANYWLAYNITGIGGTANKFVFAIHNNSSWQAVSSSTTPVVGQWYHILGVKDGTTLRFYLNGTQENTSTFTGSPRNSGYAFSVGAYRGLESMNGYLSNIRLVTGASNTIFPYSGLTSGSSFTVPSTPLTAVSGTQLLTCQSNRFLDNSSNSHSTGFNGTPKVQPFSPLAPTRSYSKDAVGGSVYYDGSGDYLTYTTDNATPRLTTNWSIEFWMYLIAHGSSGYLQQHGGSASNFNTTNGMSFQLYEVNNNMYYNPANGSGGFGNLQTSTRPPLNAWTHMVITNDGTQTSIFMNGVRVLNGTTGFEDMHNATTNNKIQLGYLAGSNYQTKAYFTGLQYHNTEVYDASSSTITVPTAPKSADANTLLLSNFTNAGIIDHTMRNNLETEGNTRISGQQTKFGTGSIYFDGAQDYCVIPSSELFDFGTGEFTIEMFIYPTVLNGAAGLIASFNDPGSGWRFVSDSDGKLRFNNDSAQYVTATGLITINNWYHVVLTRTSGTLKMFIDGTERQTASYTTAINRHNSTSNILVGKNSLNVDNWYFEGYIDELRVSKGVARYTSNFTAPTKAFANR